MSRRSMHSIQKQRSLSRSHNHKKMTAKNTKQLKSVMSKTVDFEMKTMKKQIDSQIEIRQTAIDRGDHEMYAHANKILILMILDLIAIGTKKAAKLANQYKEKTGLEINEKQLQKRLNTLPTAKNTIKKIRNTANHPPPGSIASGWVW